MISANQLTILRMAFVPLLVLLVVYNYLIGALAVFMLACVTDLLDGFIARKFGQKTPIGAFLDPIADKLIVVSTILMLVAFGRIEGLNIVAALIILCREILVSGLREFLATLTIQVPVTQLAKWKTALQLVALGGLILGEAAPVWLPAELVGLSCLWIAAALTAYTGYGYIRAGMKHIW